MLITTPERRRGRHRKSNFRASASADHRLATHASAISAESEPERSREGQGLARDMRVRWALEEVGQPYDVRLLSMTQLNTTDPKLPVV